MKKHLRLSVRLGILTGLLFVLLVAVGGQTPVWACRPCYDCADEFEACVGDCPIVNGGPAQACYNQCYRAENRCYSYCCMEEPGDGQGGGGCPARCPYACDASGECF